MTPLIRTTAKPAVLPEDPFTHPVGNCFAPNRGGEPGLSARLDAQEGAPVRVAEILAALTYALDLTEGQPAGHALRTCVIGMAIGREIGLDQRQLTDLYYALLMKDAGCSTNASRMYQIMGSDDIAAKRDVKTTDWTRLGWDSLQYALSHVKTGAPFLARVRALASLALQQERNARDLVRMRCERGASIARRLGMTEGTAEAIHSLDELWNGRGHPQGLRGDRIPLLSRILNLAQSMDVFYTHQGAAAAVETAQSRSGSWFDPDLVEAFCSTVRRSESLGTRQNLWQLVDAADESALNLEPAGHVFTADAEMLDRIAMAFADVIDAKSPFTYRHSMGVAGAAVAIGGVLGLEQTNVDFLRRAALLHDIGKLGVSNAILDKPAALTAQEWDLVRHHPRHSGAILSRIPGFGRLSLAAAAHHEKLDGSGYCLGLTGVNMSLSERILVVADIYDALAANRPYRQAMPVENVLEILRGDAPRALDADCVEALAQSLEQAHSVRDSLLALSLNVSDRSHAPVPAEDPQPSGADVILTDRK